MTNTICRWYRVLATGIGYLVFGLVVTIFSVILQMTPEGRTTPELRRRRQLFASGAFRVFLSFLKTIGVLQDVDYDGLDRLPEDEPCVFVSNHPMLLDPIFILAGVRFADCIVKEKYMPFFRHIARWLDYIPDRHSMELFEECVERIEQGRNLLFFPEGTRSPEGGLRTFSRVPAQVGLASNGHVVPTLIECNHHTFRKDQPWYEVPPEPLYVKITFFEPYTPELDGSLSVRSRELTEEWRSFYRDHLPIDDENK